MPNVIDRFPEFIEENKLELEKGGYYVYAWFCYDWGGICYYVGKGKKDRYKAVSSRGMSFGAIYRNWDVYPVIIKGGLTEEQAEMLEDETKSEFIFERGYPVMDGEGNGAALKNRAIRKAKAIKRANDPDWKEGRKKIEVCGLQEYMQKHSDGLMTVEQCCKELNISRSTWNRRVRELL